MQNILFKKIDVEDIGAIKQHTKKFPPYSDFNPLSLLTWNANDDNSYAIIENNLIIKIKDYLTDNYLYSILGLENLETTIDKLLTITDTLKFVPEFIVEKVKIKYRIEEDRDNFDYIVKTADLASLKGNRLKNVRHSVNIFKTNYPNYETRILDLSNKNDINLVYRLNEDWCASKAFDKTKSEEDMDSIKKFIKYSKYFNTFTLGVFFENSMVAFTFNEFVRQNWAIGHFGKSNNKFNKSSCFIEYATSLKLNEMNYEFINIEQDAGLLKLRVTKKSFAPDHFLKKYTVKKL